MRDAEVLIVGAGPTGLVLALWLTRLGIRVRIVDKTTEPGTTSRALAVHARTLEWYRQIGLADEVVDRGRQMASINLWVSGGRLAHAKLGTFGAGLSPFPYVLIFPQDEHERLLIDRLRDAGVNVERDTEVMGLEETASGVQARLLRPDGSAARCDVDYLAGCDGAHSVARRALGIGFQGGTYEHLFYVADVEARGSAIERRVTRGARPERLSRGLPLARARTRASGRHRARRPQRSGRAVLGRREHARHRLDADYGRAGALVFDVPRAPSRRGSVPQGPRVPARRRRAHPQPRRRAGNEHRYRRRDQPGVEARRRAPGPCPMRRSWTATSRNASASRGAWSRRQIRRSPA